MDTSQERFAARAKILFASLQAEFDDPDKEAENHDKDHDCHTSPSELSLKLPDSTQSVNTF